MIYEKFPPPSVLSPFVECYFIWDSGTSLAQPLRVESPPTGFASIVFNYGDGYRLSNQTHQELSVPRFFLGGQAVGRYELYTETILTYSWDNSIVREPQPFNWRVENNKFYQTGFIDSDKYQNYRIEEVSSRME